MVNRHSSVDSVFHALADPTRRAIVYQLSRGEASVSDVAKPLAMSLAAVVQQIQLLEECGVIRTQKIGRVRVCRVEPHSLALVEQWLSARRSMWEGHLDRLGAVLAQQKRARRARKRTL